MQIGRGVPSEGAEAKEGVGVAPPREGMDFWAAELRSGRELQGLAAGG